MRLDKYVADALGMTRSEARTTIKKGGITVDGEAVTAPASQISCQEVCYRGEKLRPTQFVYIMMNKPAGCLSATEDKNQKTVLDLLDEKYRRYGLFPAGRLDKDTEGFLLLTNDGQLAHSLLSPKKKVGKKYLVRLSRPLDDEKIYILENGVDIGGYITQPCTIQKVQNNIVYITITEGKFHQVKKMFLAVDNHVDYLKRVSFGGLDLDESLEPGQYRQLCTKEMDKILRTIQ